MCRRLNLFYDCVPVQTIVAIQFCSKVEQRAAFAAWPSKCSRASIFKCFDFAWNCQHNWEYSVSFLALVNWIWIAWCLLKVDMTLTLISLLWFSSTSVLLQDIFCPSFDICTFKKSLCCCRPSEPPYITRWTLFHFHVLEEVYKEGRVGS